MRRGHPGASGGGWRNDGPRHFRTRGGPSQRFRGSRGFGPQNTPRFHSPGPRFHGQNFGSRGGPPFDDRGPHQGRGHFNNNTSIFPQLQRMRQGPPSQAPPYADNSFYNPGEDNHGPVGPFGPWSNPPPQFFEKQNRFDEEHKIPSLLTSANYGGHRPPASDHYGSNPAASNDNSDTFSRSVDDTVDIIRQRLINRESHVSTDNLIPTPENDSKIDDTHPYESQSRQEPVIKKRHKPRNVNRNCDQMKTKIVHQLFMMDKDRIHKLMDNPSSSSKFEFAISSLITESQNSYNRHLRTMAEKSLDSTSSEFVNHDNNTIYEDTFMKQMQCILEPQDTVLLEDIKPIVLAELQKVLQLNSDQNYGLDEQAAYSGTNQFNYDPEFPTESHNEYPYNSFTAADEPIQGNDPEFLSESHNDYSYLSFTPANEPIRVKIGSQQYGDYENKELEESKLFERRHSRKSSESRRSDSKERSERTHRSDEKRGEENTFKNRTQSSDYSISRNNRREKYSYRNRTPSSESSRNRSSRREEENRYKNRTPSSDRSRSRDDRTRASSTHGQAEPVWECVPVQNEVGDYMTPQEGRVWGTMNEPIQEDRDRGSKISIPETSKTPVLEDSRSRSETPTKNDIYNDKHTPAEDRFNYKNIPIPVDRIRGSHTDKLRTRESMPVSDHPLRGSKPPESEPRFSDSQTSISEDRFIESKPLLLEDKFVNSNTQVLEDRLGGSESPKPSTIPAPAVFDANANDLSDEDEAFAELDRQYHVAVDRDHHYDLASPADSLTRGLSPGPPPKENTPEIKTENQIYTELPKKPPVIDNDVNSQLLALSLLNTAIKSEINDNVAKQELKSPGASSLSDQTTPNTSERSDTKENVSVNQDKPVNHNTSPTSSRKPNPSQSRKRSTDQKPSHRKEKRKKLEVQSESKKPSLNKVNECAPKNSDKSSTPKSSDHNSFFSKEKGKRVVDKDEKKSDKDTSDKGRRKESKEKESSKTKECEDKKRLHLSTTNQTLQSPPETNCVPKTPVKEENKKLKTFDMFQSYNKKPTIIRLNEAPKKTLVAVKPIDDTNTKLGFGRKLTKRHVGTQVIRKNLSKETQTPTSKGCYCKDKKKLVTLSVQTEPVSFKKTFSNSDPFERMKEIDMEIQVLLQEKFTLYNSMESKDNSMHSLGMAVLNVDSIQPAKNQDLEDTIVDDFANIPVEELEQIAFESVGKASPVKSKKKKSGPNPVTKKVKSAVGIRNRKVVNEVGKSETPNISLIEQIISDDRPLEEIISLDDFEVTPVKKKYTKRSQPKKSQNQKTPSSLKTPAILKTYPVLKTQSKQKVSILKHMIDQVEYGIKECCVVLKREDLSKYMTKKNEKRKEEQIKPKTEKASRKLEASKKTHEEQVKEIVPVKEIESHLEESTVIEEAVVNDVFDMLDVSEDIVIGESCEVKSADSKNASDTSVTTCEEIILDNSQSSLVPDSVVPIEGPNDSECKLFDYSADESLKRDAITVIGNNDAVLAIECIDNNFIAACLDGNVYYFSGEGQLINTLRGSNLAVTCLTIVREKHGVTVYTGSLDSRIRYYDLETGLEKGPEGNVLSPIQTMDRAWDTIFVGTRTGFVLQFECRNNMLIPVSTVKFSDQSILALRAMKEGPRKVLLVAARSEAVTIKDAQSGLLLRTLEGPKMTVYTLLFEDGKVYCGTSNHQIHVFDYASGGHVGVHEGGKGAVCLRGAGGLVFAGCYDGCVYVYREGQPQPLAQLRGPGLMLLSLAVIGSKIIAGYKDRSLYIWKMPESVLSEMIL